MLIVLMLLTISGNASYGVNPGPSSSDLIHKMIKESIKYPEQAYKKGCTGSVDVLFSINKEGKIDIDKLSTGDKEIAEGVKKQLSAVCCKGIKTPYDQHYWVTIRFKLI
jgi:hypothetical protein